MTTVGHDVKVRGKVYRVIGAHHKGHLGSKFFGKFLWELVDEDGARYQTFGKAVVWNSTLVPVTEEGT